jgi:hypothetical protein
MWRAILAGRKALQVGLIHRIGLGESVSIWNDSLDSGGGDDETNGKTSGDR